MFLGFNNPLRQPDLIQKPMVLHHLGSVWAGLSPTQLPCNCCGENEICIILSGVFGVERGQSSRWSSRIRRPWYCITSLWKRAKQSSSHCKISSTQQSYWLGVLHSPSTNTDHILHIYSHQASLHITPRLFPFSYPLPCYAAEIKQTPQYQWMFWDNESRCWHLGQLEGWYGHLFLLGATQNKPWDGKEGVSQHWMWGHGRAQGNKCVLQWEIISPVSLSLPRMRYSPGKNNVKITRILPDWFRGSRKEFCKGSNWSMMWRNWCLNDH